MEANIITINESAINGRHVWMYKVESGLPDILVVQHEQPDKQIITEVFSSKEADKAMKRYNGAIKAMLSGKG